MLEKSDRDLLLEATKKSPYSFVLDEDTLKIITDYKQALVSKDILPGIALKELLNENDDEDIPDFIDSLTTLGFINLLLNLKVPNGSARISLAAPSQSEYNIHELNILARIGTVIYTHVHNDGKQSEFDSYETPVPCIMGFVSAPLFDINDSAPANQEPVNSSSGRNQINSENYIKEMKHRILPVLIKMNDEALMRGKKLSITIPGLGCGIFAGCYSMFRRDNDNITAQLDCALRAMLIKHEHRLKCIINIQFDELQYDGHSPLSTEQKIGHIWYKFVADATSTNSRAPLALAKDSSGEDVMLGTIVEGDLLSWMGKGMWIDNGLQTDERRKTGGSLVLAQISQWIYRNSGINIITRLLYNRETGEYSNSSHPWPELAHSIQLNDNLEPYASTETTVFVLNHNGVLEDIRIKDSLSYIKNKLSEYLKGLNESSSECLNAHEIVNKIEEYSDLNKKHDIPWLRNECKPHLKALLVNLEAEPENLYDRLISALRYVFGKIDFFDITPKTFGLNWSHFFTPNYTQVGKDIDAFNTQLENSFTNL